MTVYDELVARGLIAQVTDEEEIKELINHGKATFYIGLRSDGGQPSCRALHGAVSDETASDGRKPPHRPDRRRHRHGGRSLWPHRYAPDDDGGDHRAQLRLLPEADEPLYRFFRRKGPSREQCGLADELKLH